MTLQFNTDVCTQACMNLYFAHTVSFFLDHTSQGAMSRAFVRMSHVCMCMQQESATEMCVQGGEDA